MKAACFLALGAALIAWLWHINYMLFVIHFCLILALGATSVCLGSSTVINTGRPYKPHVSKVDCNTASLLILKMMENRRAQQTSRHKIVTTRNLDLALQEVLDYVIRDYVLSWYDTLGKDSKQFKSILQQEVWYVLEEFQERLENIEKVRFITKDIVKTLCKHFQNIRTSLEKPEDGVSCPKFQLHPWLKSKEREVEFLHKVAEIFLIYLLPSYYSTCHQVRHLLKEILANAVLVPAVDLICDPDYINEKLYTWLSLQESLLAQHQKTYTYAASYEEFMQLIEQSSDVDELKTMRYNIISEIMQATTIQNLKRAKGLDTDKESAPKGTTKGDLLKARNLKRYINQLTIAKTTVERQIYSLGGPDYKSDTEATRKEEHQKMRGKKVLAFRLIMDSAEARNHLMKYLLRDGQESLLHFWSAVETMRKSHKCQWHQMATEIYQMYIASPISLVRLLCDRSLVKGMESFMIGDTGPSAFHEAQEHVYHVLEEQHYPSFLLSDIYHSYMSLVTEKGHDLQTDNATGQGNADSRREHRQSTKDDIAEHSTYALQKLQALDDKILNKSQALHALKHSQKPDPRVLRVQEDVEAEIKTLRLERRQLEFHIDRTEVWLENLARWRANIYNAEVVKEGDKLIPYFVVVIHLPGSGIGEGSSQQQSGTGTCNRGSHTQGWIISRQLEDFHHLHEQLIQINPSLKRVDLPSISKLWFRTVDEDFLGKSKAALDNFLFLILSDDRVSQSEAVFAFFSPSPEHLKQAPSSSKKKFPFGNIFKSQKEQESDSDDELLFVDDDSGKVERSKDSIAKPLYLLTGEIFELRGMFRWLRRTLMVFVKVTFGNSINRQLRDTVHWVVSEPMLIYYLHAFRDAYWPNGELVQVGPPHTDEEKLRMRYNAKEKILKNVPDVVKSLVGEKNARQGYIKVFEALQDERLNKHLFYNLLELFLYEAFPELNELKSSQIGVNSDLGKKIIFCYEEKKPVRYHIPPYTI